MVLFGRIFRAIVATWAVFAVSPADACSIAPPQPPLPGESDKDYHTRTEALAHENEVRWLKERQEGNLQRADWVFVARHVEWSPPYNPSKPKYRNGIPVIIPRPKFEYPTPTYFKPLRWLKGPEYSKVFKVETFNTSCGPMSLGDTKFSEHGSLFVFFARKGRITDNTLIDAIAVDKINDPALIDFVRPYRSSK
jgi:hypothetical protein